MSVVTTCLAVFAAWGAMLCAVVNHMSKKEVADYYELQVSKAAHPAGKSAEWQNRRTKDYKMIPIITEETK